MVKYFKGDPSKFVIKYVSGKVKAKGLGRSFFYEDYKTQIAAIPSTTLDGNFIFNEVTKNYQAITLQGQYTYRIKDPAKMATILNFTIDPVAGTYKSQDPEKISLRITNAVQMAARNEISNKDLEETLTMSSEQLAARTLENVARALLLNDMGVEVIGITFTGIRPTPEISKALEAEYRENLQRKADQAIYARRAAAVEQERIIKENELNTQIKLEEQRKQLIELSGVNQIKDAEIRAKVRELELETYKKVPSKLLLALAMKELAANAGKIGNLTITSEILAQLLTSNEELD